MIPLVICSLVSVAFIFERGFALRRREVISEPLAQAIDALKIGGSTTAIEHLAAPGRTTLERLVRTCLEHLPWSKAENVEAVQTRARAEVIQLERGLVLLEITVGIGPLLGLLGTVSGLVGVFGGLGSGDLASEGMVIARGISEALNTTVAGLVIAIPSLIAHSYYTKKVERMMVEMESICMDLLAKLYLQPEEER
jgi:biopolymer transport protein ExbB